jgi:GxxExxY protein
MSAGLVPGLPRQRFVALRADPLAQLVIGSAIEVHRHLGPGLLESTYRRCLVRELDAKGIHYATEVPVAVTYKGAMLDCSYRLDLLIDGRLIVEIKAVERLLPVHTAQVLTYLKLTDAKQALLINFNSARLVNGLRSFLR